MTHVDLGDGYVADVRLVAVPRYSGQVFVEEGGQLAVYTAERAEMLIDKMRARLDRIKEALELGLTTDGAHHKQWALAEIAVEFGIIAADQGVAP